MTYTEEALGSITVAAVVTVAAAAAQGVSALIQFIQARRLRLAVERDAATIARIRAEIAEAEARIQEMTGRTSAEISRQNNIKMFAGVAAVGAGLLAAFIALK